MTGTILSYLKEYGGFSFKEHPINDVDALILCQLSYLKFDGMVPDVNVNLPFVSLKEVAEAEDREKLFGDERYEKVNRELFSGLLGSRRFGEMGLNWYVNLVEKDWETQFSAVTFQLENGTVFVTFRGTDESITGWKEDFNMAWLCPVPAQRCSTRYLNMVAQRFPGDFITGGHSKGGNLAVYSALTCMEQVQDRILKIYSMDGPGLRQNLLEQYGFQKIEDRVIKILPHSSLIGMLFEQDIHYQVIESRSVGLFQHDPYSWIVRDDHFIQTQDLYESRKFMDHTINQWLLSLNQEQLEIFVDTLFQILEASGAQDLLELGGDRRRRLAGMAGALKALDGETAQIMGEVLMELFEIAGNRVLQEIGQKIKNMGRAEVPGEK